ncbi:MAG: site-specific DNA-methyltransferase [Bdellovibrionales bacterium]|nr:site-specific DNA-methyltransferase [Bdellovibrionales bacterium]
MGTKLSTSICGDALEVLANLPTASVDACITDPPYNMSKKKGLSWAFSSHVTMQEIWDRFSKDEFADFTIRWLKEVFRVVKPNGNLLVFGTYHNIYLTGFLMGEMDRKVLNSIVWSKPNAQPNITCRMLTESTEQVVWACNESPKKATGWTFNYQDGKAMNGGKQLRNHWVYPVTPKSERVAGHPTQKPLQLMERLIQLFTNKGDMVLDPFAGVGTTGVAALKHGRRCVLIERQSPYVRAQKKRFSLAGLSRIEFKSQKSQKRSGAQPAPSRRERNGRSHATL